MATTEPIKDYDHTIADQIKRLQKAKSDLKAAIKSKGVTVSDDTLISGYAQKVNLIEQGGGSSSDGWAYFYADSCYVDNMLNVYDHITKSNVTLEIYHWGETGPTGWVDHNTQKAPHTGSSYVPVYFRAKANSSAGGYFQFQTSGHAARVNVKSFQSFGDIDTSINYISSVQAISGGAD